MPVGAIAGAVGIGGAAISSNASKKAASTVANSTDRAADLQNQQFNRLLELQMPGYRRGEEAAGIYGALLGIPSMSAAMGNAPTTAAQPSMTGGNGQPRIPDSIASDPFYSKYPQAIAYAMEMAQDGDVSTAQYGQATPVTATGTTGTNQQALQATLIDQIRNTPGYQAQLDQGLKAIDRAAPLTGGMYSGRRMKALNDHGQNTFGAYYNDTLNRIGGLAGQASQTAQSIGQAGMQNATNVGNLLMTGANAQAQGRMNSASAWSGALGVLGNVGMYGAGQGWFGK